MTDAPLPALIADLTSVSAKTGGGVGRVATGVLEGLRDLGVPARCLIAPGTSSEWASIAPDLETEEIAVRMHAGSRWQSQLRRLLPASLKTSRLVGAVRQVRGRAVRSAAGDDVVWYPFHRSVATATASVVTVHDLRVFEAEFASPMDQRIIEDNVAKARALVCSWPHPYESLIARFPEARDRIFQIPLPVLNAGSPVEGRRAPEQTVTLLYPGYVTEHKDHATVVRALALLPDARLICTGAETEYARTVRALAEELGVADRIEWRGYVDQAELEAAYREADILVMPSLWEAASGPILEAVVRRIPFVSSDIPPLEAQVRQLGLPVPEWTFAARDERSLADSVSASVAAYDAHVEALAEPAARLTERSWKSTASDYERVFAWVQGTGDRPTDLQPGLA